MPREGDGVRGRDARLGGTRAEGERQAPRRSKDRRTHLGSVSPSLDDAGDGGGDDG